MQIEDVKVLLVDTNLTPDGGPTTGSLQTYILGNAVKFAARTMKEVRLGILSEKFEVPLEEINFVKGLAQMNGQKVPFGRISEIIKEEGRESKAYYEYWAPKTFQLEQEGDKYFA